MFDQYQGNVFNPIHSVAGFYKGANSSRCYNNYSILTDVMILLILCATVYQLFTTYSEHEKESLSVSLVVCIAYSLALYYSLCFRLQYGKIIKLHTLFHETLNSLSHVIDGKSVLQGYQHVIKNNKTHGFSTCLTSFMSAFLFSLQPLLRNAAVFGMDGRKQLQIDIWCPFEYRKPVIFEITVLLQSLTVFWVALRFFATDSFFLMSMKTTILFFKLLTEYGETVFPGIDIIDAESHEQVAKTSNPSTPPVNINNQMCEVAELKLKMFIKNHQLILRCGKQVCEIYGPVMLMYLLSLMAFVSVAAFGVIHTNGFKGPQTLAVGFFSIINVLFLHCMCEAGDDLALQSGKVGEALVGGALYLGSRSIRSSLVVVQQRINCRVQACVVGVPSTPLSLSTYAWFIKALVSFYLFLVQIHQEARNEE